MHKQPLTYDSRYGRYYGRQSDGMKVEIDADIFAEARQRREREGLSFDEALKETSDPDGWGSEMSGWLAPAQFLHWHKAGRKALPDGERKGRYTMYLLPATVAALEAFALPNEALGQALDRFVQEHMK